MKKEILFLMMIAAIMFCGCEDDEYSAADLEGGWEVVSYVQDGETYEVTDEDYARYFYFSGGHYYSFGLVEISNGLYKLTDNKIKLYIKDGDWEFKDYVKIKSLSSNKMVLIIYNTEYTFRKNDSVYSPT